MALRGREGTPLPRSGALISARAFRLRGGAAPPHLRVSNPIDLLSAQTAPAPPRFPPPQSFPHLQITNALLPPPICPSAPDRT